MRRSLIATNRTTIRRRSTAYLLLSLVLVGVAVIASGAEWQSSAGTHTGFELTASLLAATISALALVRYYNHKQLPYLLAATGFGGAAMFDAFHTFTSSEHFASASAALDPNLAAWGWMAGRTFLAVFLLAAAWIPSARLRPGRKTETLVFTTGLAIVLLTFLVITSVPLPDAYIDGSLISRPYDLVAGALFIAAFVGLYRLRAWGHDTFHHWLLLSVLVEAAVQTLYIPFTPAPFTAQFDVAHGAKVSAYVLMLFGLIASMHQLVQNAHEREAQREELNRRLTHEVARRAGAEAELLDQKTDLEAILEGMAEGVVLVGREGEVIRVNRGAREILGMELAGSPQQYLAELKVFQRDRKTPVPYEETGLAMALRGETLRGHLFWLKTPGRPDGFFVRSNVRPIRDEAGEIDGAVAVFHDVTLEESARQAATEREERLDALVRTANDAIVSIDHESHILEFNPAAEELFGWSAEEAIGQPVTTLMPERFRPLHLNGMRRFLDTGEGALIGNTVEVEALHRNGEEIPIELSLGFWRTAGVPRFTAIIRDIRERRETEALLRKSEQTYRAMVSEVQDYAIFMLDPEGHIQTWNEGATRMTGYSADEVIGRPAVEVFPEDPNLVHALKQAKEGRAETNSWHTRKDGSRYYTACVITSITDADGQLIGLTKIMNDQTAQREAEEQLRQSEHTYRAMVSEVQDYAIYMLDPEGRIQTWNEGATRIYGYRYEEAVGRHFHTFFAPESAEDDPDVILAEARAGRAEREGWRVRKDGTRYYVNSIVTPITDDDGRLLGYTKITHDQTVQREAEQLLRESEERYRLLAENASDLIVVHDEEGGFDYVSPAARWVTGYDVEDLLGRQVYDLLHPEDRTRLRRQHERILEERKPLRETVRFIHKDGGMIWLECAMRWIRGQSAEAQPQILATYRDVTERVQDRNALARSNEELQEFAFIASHDLKEPLRKIIAFGDRIESQCAEELGPRGIDYLGRMRSAAERMRRLLDDLLAYSRVTTRAEAHVEVDLEEVAQNVLEDLSEAIVEAHAEVRVSTLPRVRGDPTQLRQALQNLISNALKYHRDNEPPLVHLAGGRHDGEQWVRVQDNGIGFEMRYADRIFRPFQRLHGRSEYSGSGMGLAIVRKIVERHNGRIDVESEPGRGTTFTIRLPVTTADDGDTKDQEAEPDA